MDTTEEKKKAKRPSKGQRKHNRLVKQEARKVGLPEPQLKKRTPQK